MVDLKSLWKQTKATNLSSDEYLLKQCQWENESVGTLTGYDCPLCNNKGYTSGIDGNTVVRYECQCAPIRKSLKRMEKSGLKNALQTMTLDQYQVENPIQKQVKNKAIGYCHDLSGAWFFIGGQVGAGKTHICTAICGELLQEGQSVLYMLWKDVSTELKANANDALKYAELITPYKTVNVLYMDDFLKVPKNSEGRFGRPTEADLKLAFEIVNYRYQAGKKTIISTEWRADELVDVEESIGSRIYEKSKGYQISIPRNKDYNYRLKD